MPDENFSDATQPVGVNSDKTQPIPLKPEDATHPVRVGETAVESSSPGNNLQSSENPDPEDIQEGDTASEEPPKSWRGRIILAGLFVILLLGALGAYLGYQSGLQSRIEHQASQVAAAAATQFQLGLDDMENGRYVMARGRFEYVISLDPNFPGVKEKLTEVMIALIPTTVPTATLTPTPAYTPTPDTRGEQEMFRQIQQSLADKKWDEAIVSIEALRTKNIGYETIAVDGLYYIALRNRGVDKILVQGDLEGGMYDLALTARFGPLDRDAESYQVWARYYVTGASFWEVDWEKASYYFGLVAPYLPNLRDSSNIFAIDRYRQAATHYAQQLLDDGESCKADELLNSVLVNNYRDATAEPLATQAYRRCHPPTETPKPAEPSATPTETPTPSLTPTLGGTVQTPLPTQTNTTAPVATTPAATAPAATAPAATATNTATVPAPTASNTPVPPTATMASQSEISTSTPTPTPTP